MKSLGFFSEKPVQLIDFTGTIHVNVNNTFFLFVKNHENCSSCRMNFVRNEIVIFLKKN